MSGFKINFRLQELDKVMPFGGEDSFWIHWYALTDGFLWIEAGEQTLYEYSEAAHGYFHGCPQYNDYQVARFVEDFTSKFKYVSESVPEWLFEKAEHIRQEAYEWKQYHIDDPDDVFDVFYDNEFSKLIEWHQKRSFDTLHLVDGPYISIVRCGDHLKLMWDSDCTTELGCSVWTAPNGLYEMKYCDFVSAATEFLNNFIEAMDRQVEAALIKDWGDISVDKKGLVNNHAENKSRYYDALSCLMNDKKSEDWSVISDKYEKMCRELNK